MESEAIARSREAWLKSVERFSQSLEKQLEEARARPTLNEEEIRNLEQTQIKLLTLWKRVIGKVPAEAKKRWIRREQENSTQDSTVDQSASQP